MLPDAQLLTISTTFANYKHKAPLSPARSVVASGFLLVQAGTTVAKQSQYMAHHYFGSRHEANTEQELWFSMSSSSRRQQDQGYTYEQSAYRSTTNRLSSSSTSSTSSRPYSNIPLISTTADTNKPLPPSPPGSERKKRKSTGLRSMLGRQSSSPPDPNHLQPQPYISNQRYSATTTNLSIDTQGQYHHAYSRSMPSSPYEPYQAPASPNSATLPRAHSAAGDYLNTTQYLPYNPAPQSQTESMQPVRPVRSTSMNTYFETTPPRANTFPAETVSSPTMREGVTNRPRPHTWLSPTESFSDPSQFSLFAQATTGLPNEVDPFSVNSPPQLQGSLFARRSGNDTIPIPLQRNAAAPPANTHLRTDWQNFEPPSFSSRSVSAPISSIPGVVQYQDSAHINQVNRELELLGLEDSPPDDELPDYAQSQAEAHARRRQEASARARELEARWRSTRGR